MDRRIERTRQLITDTFIELLGSKGFEKLTIRDISERANINRGTVYLHFTDKYDILDKCIERYIGELLVNCQETSGEHAFAELEIKEDAMLSIFKYLQDNIDIYRLLLKNDKTGEFHNKLHRVLMVQTKYAIDMLPDKYIDSKDVTIEFLTNGFLGVIEWWLNAQDPASPEEITNQMLSILVQMGIKKESCHTNDF